MLSRSPESAACTTATPAARRRDHLTRPDDVSPRNAGSLEPSGRTFRLGICADPARSFHFIHATPYRGRSSPQDAEDITLRGS